MKTETIQEILWNQIGASVDMLEKALNMCPENLWNTKDKFWYKAYHTLFFLDYYLSPKPDDFHPPQPFGLSEFDPSGAMPERVYSKDELLGYLSHCREKCKLLISSVNFDNPDERWVNARRNYSMTEIIIYNMRHVQHHAAQLYLLLRQGMDNAPSWVSRTTHDIGTGLENNLSANGDSKD